MWYTYWFMVKRYLCITAAAAALLSAANVSTRRLSPDFVKAGLKAVIAIKNGVHYGATRLDDSRVQDALTDAEAAAATKNDKSAFHEIEALHAQSDLSVINFSIRFSQAQIKLLGSGEPQSVIEQRAASETVGSPETLKEKSALLACSAGIEKMLRSGAYTAIAPCDALLDDTLKSLTPKP